MATVQIPYTVAGTYQWTCPADVTGIGFWGIGGGGAGGSQSSSASKSGGGGGGACVVDLIVVTPGTTYTITVGAGGVVSATAGGAGGATSFGSTSVAGGGGGGGTGSSGTGGTAGTAGVVTAGGVYGSYSGGAGASGSSATGTSGTGGGGGSSGNNGHAGNSAQSPSNTIQQGGLTTAGGTPLGTGGAGGVGSITPQGTPSSTAGTSPGGGGGGAFRYSSGTQSGSAGAAGQAVLQFTTNDPYVIQSSGIVGTTSGSGFSLPAGVATGSTVIAVVGASSGSMSSVTLGGVAGTRVPGLNPAQSTGVQGNLEVWKWENVTGNPSAIVGSTVGGVTWSGAALEIGNAGTITNEQAVVNSSTAISLTPAQTAKGQLQIIGAMLNGSFFGTTTSVPGAPWTEAFGGTGSIKNLQCFWYSAASTTAQTAAFAASTGDNAEILIAINPPASRGAFQFGNE